MVTSLYSEPIPVTEITSDWRKFHFPRDSRVITCVNLNLVPARGLKNLLHTSRGISAELVVKALPMLPNPRRGNHVFVVKKFLTAGFPNLVRGSFAVVFFFVPTAYSTTYYSYR